MYQKIVCKKSKIVCLLAHNLAFLAVRTLLFIDNVHDDVDGVGDITR